MRKDAVIHYVSARAGRDIPVQQEWVGEERVQGKEEDDATTERWLFRYGRD